MTAQPLITFNDGNSIPKLGLGVWQTPADVTGTIVETAIKAGYRHVDTAAIYRNEDGVGSGIRSAAVARDEIFVTTKLWNDDQGFDSALRAFDESMEKLGLDTLDLYLVHWPAPKKDLYVESWRALIRLKEEGRVRSIGVSNFCVEHLDRIIDETGIVPVLNQIELHPRFQQHDLRAAHAARGIATQSWSPLGRGGLLEDPLITQLASKHDRTPAQIVIRWHLESGLIVIPKSATPSRIVDNFDVFGFTLDAADMAAIAALDSAEGRTGPDPMTAAF